MTLLWYDLETFGRHSRYDRIAQFAALRTDEHLRPIEDPILLYGRLSPDYLPDPLSCLITGITPQQANSKGLSEAVLVRAIDSQLSRPGTCALGFNSISFDDEFIRNLYYRNFFDPYRREWMNGNSRWDILDLVRATRDLRPEGIHWPQDEKGRPSVKLELLSAANGLEHNQAHDALSDVHATIAVARLIREKQPKLYDWAWKHHKKDQVRTLVNLEDRTPLVYTSSMLFSEKGNTSLVSPLVTDPLQRNLVHSFDLRYDPGPLLSLSPSEIRRRIFTPKQELAAEGIERIPIIGIAMNKAPFLAPHSVLGEQIARRLGIDIPSAMERWERLQKEESLAGKLREVFSHQPDWGNVDDPDFQIYERFFPDEDKSLLERIRNASVDELIPFNVQSKDPRIPEMLRRYLGRNYPEHLEGEQRRKWRSFCASRILFPPIPDVSDLGEFRKRLAAWMDSEKLEAGKKTVIKALKDYGDQLEDELLGQDS